MGWTNSAARRSLANLSAQPSVENSGAGLRDPAPAARLDPAERVAPSAPQPPGAGACRRFQSLLARVEGSGLGWCWSSGTTTHARGYRANTAKRIRSCCPGRRGLAGGGWKPNHRESELRPHFTSSALRPSVVALSAGVAGDRGFVREAKSTLKGSTLGPPSILI